jgi:putative CocE/NonD family hydrolase
MRTPARSRLRATFAGLLAVAAVALPAVVAAPPPVSAAPTTFVTMPDGVKLAIAVRMPDGYVAGQRYPTVFEMSGYDGGSAKDGTLVNDFGLESVPVLPATDSSQLTKRFRQDYVVVHASVRGTGCSGGEFDLFSSQTGLDGKHIIDEYIARQAWSNGKVAIMGHSYSGITGFQVAAARPQHLVAMTVSGLIDDVYRGLVYPGGVTNYGFPLLWTGGVRPLYDVAGGLLPGLVRSTEPGDDPDRQSQCATTATTKGRTITNDPIVQGLSDTDNDWFRSRSLINVVDRIQVPIHITGAYQDEQTGPRGPFHLWEQVRGVPKRLLATNGDHNTQNPGSTGPEVYADRIGWIDHWMGVRRFPTKYGNLADDKTSVTTLFELHRDAAGVLRSNGRLDSTSYPLEQSTFTPWYLQAGGKLSKAAPGLTGGSDTYLSGLPRHAWSYQAGPAIGPPITTFDGPDHLTFQSEPVAAPTAIAGPIRADLWISSTAPDTELFVQLIDEAADGSRTYLQRGLLKASHRAIDDSRSDKTASGFRYRPWRTHTNPTNVTPLTTERYEVEVWPVGHVFRPGHRIKVLVTSPPLADSYYAYVPKTVIGLNTLYHDATRPSRIWLPMVPLTGVNLGPEQACGAQEAVRCIADPSGGAPAAPAIPSAPAS